MLLRALAGLFVTGSLMWLVWWQIRITDPVFLTVENMVGNREHGLSFDRHYAMPLDFCIIAPFMGLCVFLCAPQWRAWDGGFVAIITVLIIAGCIMLWRNGHEAHALDGMITPAGWAHALFAAVGVWVVLMVLVMTPAPPAVLLLVMCIIAPAFLFVGQHMFLGMINWADDASTFRDQPLTNPVGWVVLAIGTSLVWWRAWVLIPNEYWRLI